MQQAMEGKLSSTYYHFPILGQTRRVDTMLMYLLDGFSSVSSFYYIYNLRLLMQLGFVMYVITRESIYFINLRRAYLLAPFNSARISSRTVLFTDVPVEYRLRKSYEGFSAWRCADAGWQPIAVTWKTQLRSVTRLH